MISAVGTAEVTPSPGRKGQPEAKNATNNWNTRKQLFLIELPSVGGLSEIHRSAATSPVVSDIALSGEDRDSDDQENDPPITSAHKATSKRSKPIKTVRGNARKGGHANFVRMATQNGKSSFRFKSKSGCRGKPCKNKKWAVRKMLQDSLPVAGCGADSAHEGRTVCPHVATTSVLEFLVVCIHLDGAESCSMWMRTCVIVPSCKLIASLVCYATVYLKF